MSLPDIKEWHVETLRLTVFSLEPISAAGRGWWKSVTKLDPETSINRANIGEYSESGEFLGGQFELRVAFNRADWSLSFPFSDMPGTPQPEEIHALTFKWLLAMKAWLVGLDFKLARIAAGAIFIKVVPDFSAGNKLISDYLHFVDIADNSRMEDLMVQVNCPTVFKSVSGLRHNRIVKLGVLERQLFTIGPAGFPTASIDKVLRCELDMSSSLSSHSPIPADSSYDLAAEMVQAFLMILKEGMTDD